MHPVSWGLRLIIKLYFFVVVVVVVVSFMFIFYHSLIQAYIQ